MTKLDGTAKGGILIALAKKYKLPIVALGLGEKEDDLQVFDAEKFSNAFIETNWLNFEILVVYNNYIYKYHSCLKNHNLL